MRDRLDRKQVVTLHARWSWQSAFGIWGACLLGLCSLPTLPRVAVAEVVFAAPSVITTALASPASVYVADVDGDLDMDVLAASFDDDTVAWYENDGASPPTFTAHTITTTANGARSVFAADVDGDGNTDVLSANRYDQTVAWYENDGASPPVWTTHTITATAQIAESVFASDLDGDTDMDVLSAENSADKIAWYENDGASPPSWTARIVSTTADGASSVFAADVDGDMNMDLLSASIFDDKIAWYENDGASPPTFTAHTISTTADGANTVFAADVDGDGDMDVLSASGIDDRIAWYENSGASPPTWTARTISTTAGNSVFAADVDGDTDMDVLSASFHDNEIAWYENNGASPPAWTPHTITTSADGATAVFAADMDGDADTDVLSGSLSDDTIAWYENVDPGTIIVEKQTAPDAAPGSFTFTGDVSGTIADDGTLVVGGLLPGTYTATENDPAPAFDLTDISCNDGNSSGNVGTRTATFQLEEGETVTCTFTNTEQPGTIIVEQQTSPNGAPVIFTFTGDAPGTIADNDTIVMGGLLPGTYTATENDPAPAFDLTAISCNDGNSTGNVGTRTATFQVEAGEIVTCTFTNTELGTIIVEKQTNPHAAPGSFTFTGDAPGTIADDGTLVVGSLLPGTYTATENDPAPAFALTGISCNDGNSSGNVGTRTATFQVEAGETVTCTFINTEFGTIIVEKQTNPDAAPGSFTFTGDAPGTIADDGTLVVGGLLPGTYTATENSPAPAFGLTAISCNDGNSSGNVGTRTATFQVEAGETVTCTFTNTALGTIIVEKQTSPDAAPGSFTFTGDAAGTIADDGTIVVGGLLPGSYTATENDPAPAFDLTGISCNDGNSTGNVGTRTATFNLEVGEIVTCTFTNTEQPGTIIVEKQTNPDAAPGSFTFTGDASGTIADDGTIVVGGLLPGTYTATENDPAPAFDVTAISCNDGNSSGNVGTRTATFQVEAGEIVTCTFTNTELGTIIVEKQTNPDATPGSFTFTGDASGTIADNGTIVVGGLLPGTYTATENDPAPDFALTGISCDDGNSSGNVGTRTATFNLEAGETVTCTFSNLEDPGTIIVEKQTNPDAAPGSFTFTGDAAGTIADNGTIVVGGLLPGTYTATENSPAPAFGVTAISCNDGNSTGNVGTRTATFQVEAGETVTCTFTNTESGTIIVEKQTAPDAAPGSFTFTGDAAGTIADDGTIVVGGLLPGTYTATENDPAPTFDLTGISCNDGNSSGNAGTRTATFRVEPGETVTCTFTNTESGTIIVEKQTNPDAAPGSFTFTGDATGTIADNGTIVVGGLAPGTYTATENDPAPSFSLTGVSCDDGNSTGNVGTRTATFQVEAGETVTCTFTNTESGTIIIEKQTSPDAAPGAFTFTGDAPGTIADDGTIVVGGLLPGTYTATENDPAPDFVLTGVSCNDGNSTGNVGTRTATFNVEAGEIVTCTFTNLEDPGTIIVAKQTSPSGVPGSFTFTGDASGTIGHGQTIVVGGLAPGVYTATENSPAPEFDLTGISCDDGNSSGNVGSRTATFNVEAGETVTCTFTNTEQPGIIIVVKQTSPSGVPGSFTFTGDASGTIGHGQTIVVGGLAPGVYTTTEDNPTPAFNLTDISCNDGDSTGNVGTRTATFQLAPGETVICAFTNTEQPRLTFGGTVSFGGTPLVVPGPLIAGTHLNGFGAFELEIFGESYAGTGLQDLPRVPTAPLSYVDNQTSLGLGESPASVGARWDDSVLADFELLVTGSAMTLGQTDFLWPPTNNGPADLKITLHVPFVSSASQTLDLEASFDITSGSKGALGASDFVRAEMCLYENVGDMLTDASPIPCQAAPKNGSHTVLTNVSSGTTLPHAALGNIPVTVVGGTSYIIIATWEFAVKNQSAAVDLSLSNFELTLGPGTTAVPALPPTGAWVLAAFMILAGALASWRHISRQGRWSLRR